MDVDSAREVIHNPAVQAYIEQLDSDCQAALDQADRTLGGMGAFPSGAVSEYRSHRAALDSAWGKFVSEWNKLEFEKTTSASPAISAYQKNVIELEVLEQDNVLLAAFVEANFAKFAADLLALLIAAVKEIKKRYAELLKQLQTLDAQLKKAKKELKGAEAQRVIGLAITAVGLCIPQVSLGAGIAIAVTTITVQVLVDEALGSSGSGALDTVNTTAGAVAGLPPKVKPVFAKFCGVVSGVISLKLDSDEVAEAKKTVLQVQQQMRVVDSAMRTLEPYTTASATEIAKMQTSYLKVLATAQAKGKAFKSAKAERLRLIKELDALR